MRRPRPTQATRVHPLAASPPAERALGDAEQTILAAVEELLETRPVADLTVAEIIERAGVARTTFYHYFASKNAVVGALLQRVQAELVDTMQPWFARAGREPRDALRDALEAVAGVWRRHRLVLRASSESWHSDSEIGAGWTAMLERFTRDIAAQIDRERDGGDAPPGVDSTSLALELTWGSERILYLAGFEMFGPGREEDAVDALIAMWMGVVYQRA